VARKIYREEELNEEWKEAREKAIERGMALGHSKGPTTRSEWIQGDMDQGTATIAELAQTWLDNPRRAHRKNDSQPQNTQRALNKFRPVLSRYNPDDLRVDSVYPDFIRWFEDFLESTELAKSTLDTYFCQLWSAILPYAGVEGRIVIDVKKDIKRYRKKLKIPEHPHRAITDEELVDWLNLIQGWCVGPESAPNIVAVSSPGCSMAKSQRTSRVHLLALRAYVWLALSQGGRADEIRRTRISEMQSDSVTREIMKMRTYTQPIKTSLPQWVMAKVDPYVQHCKTERPDAVFLFSESEDRTGRGTISASTLNKLVKGSMMLAGLGPTTPGGYFRIHDLRKVWARWINQNGGSIEEVCAFLTHSSTEVTFRAYYSDDLKDELRKTAHEGGLATLEALLEERDDLNARISELSDQLERVGFWSDGQGGGIYPSCWSEDDDPLVHELNSSGNEAIGSPSRIRTRVMGSRTPHDGPLH